jgi:hypothetical protein
MRCTTASGDKVIRQSRAYHRYQPGKSQLVMLTGVLGAAKANVRQRMGYFDAQNGIFLEQTSVGLRLVRRTYTSGSAVDNTVEQTAWNIDKMDGYGPSDVILDTSKAMIFVIDLEWLGVGRVRCGFVVDGSIYYVHQFNHANSLTSVYMTTANLPLRYEIENTAAAASNTDLIQICSAVISEGGFEEGRGIPFSARSGVTAKAVTTRVPLVSIRPAATLNSIVNRGTILPISVDVAALSKSALIEIVYGGALTNASFAAVDATNSLTEADIAATAISGGIVVAQEFVPAATRAQSSSPGSSAINLLSRLPLTLNIAGAHPTSPFSDALSVVATVAEANETTNVFAAINWRELY